LGVRGYVFLYEGPRSSGVGGYVFLGPLKTVVPTPLKKRGPATVEESELGPAHGRTPRSVLTYARHTARICRCPPRPPRRKTAVRGKRQPKSREITKDWVSVMMNILLLVDTTIEGASPSHARQE
jgi:hypothetical protein